MHRVGKQGWMAWWALACGLGGWIPLCGQTDTDLQPPIGRGQGNQVSSLPNLAESHLPVLGASKVMAKCRHLRRRDYVLGPVGPSWVNPRDGDLLFYNTFVNATAVAQSFSQEVEGSIRSYYDGCVNFQAACVKAGVEVIVKLKQIFPLSIPAHSSLTMTAYANLMDRPLELFYCCGDCQEVLSVLDTRVTAARGINEKFEAF